MHKTLRQISHNTDLFDKLEHEEVKKSNAICHLMITMNLTIDSVQVSPQYRNHHTVRQQDVLQQRYTAALWSSLLRQSCF